GGHFLGRQARWQIGLQHGQFGSLLGGQVGAAALLYRAILGRIEAIGYAVHRQRAHTTGLQKLLALPGILWTVWRLPTPGLPTQPRALPG
ncbi:MAG TPA: hypothetical protein PLC98_25325, partial [Anaerolineales bacterium]|nr:hypothetical protein [Anaerolineales bacterium]